MSNIIQKMHLEILRVYNGSINLDRVIFKKTWRKQLPFRLRQNHLFWESHSQAYVDIMISKHIYTQIASHQMICIHHHISSLAPSISNNYTGTDSICTRFPGFFMSPVHISTHQTFPTVAWPRAIKRSIMERQNKADLAESEWHTWAHQKKHIFCGSRLHQTVGLLGFQELAAANLDFRCFQEESKTTWTDPKPEYLKARSQLP